MMTKSVKTITLKILTVILLGFLALLFLAGCDMLLPAPTSLPTATPTRTPTPTATIVWFPPSPTPTLPASPTPSPQPTFLDDRQGIQDLIVDDDFSGDFTWTTPQSESGNVAFGVNNLTLAVAQKDAYLFSRSQHSVPSNFYLEVTFQLSLCQPEDEYGLVFWRQSENDFYRLLMNCAGQYRLELVQANESFVVYDWETAVRMQPGAPAANRIAIWVHNGRFQLYINDTFQFEEKLASDRQGELGVFARTEGGNTMTVKISDLQIYRVELE